MVEELLQEEDNNGVIKERVREENMEVIPDLVVPDDRQLQTNALVDQAFSRRRFMRGKFSKRKAGDESSNVLIAGARGIPGLQVAQKAKKPVTRSLSVAVNDEQFPALVNVISNKVDNGYLLAQAVHDESERKLGLNAPSSVVVGNVTVAGTGSYGGLASGEVPAKKMEPPVVVVKDAAVSGMHAYVGGTESSGGMEKIGCNTGQHKFVYPPVDLVGNEAGQDFVDTGNSRRPAGLNLG